MPVEDLVPRSMEPSAVDRMKQTILPIFVDSVRTLPMLDEKRPWCFLNENCSSFAVELLNVLRCV